MVIKCDLLARLVTSRARRGTFARRSEHLDCPRTRRRTDAHTRSIFFSRAHVAVHDQKHTFCEHVRMLYVSKFTFQLSSMMTVPYAHTQAPSKSATVPRSNRPTRAAPPEAPCRPNRLLLPGGPLPLLGAVPQVARRLGRELDNRPSRTCLPSRTPLDPSRRRARGVVALAASTVGG